MKSPSFTLFSTLLVTNSAVRVYGCPGFDLLAMCCVAIKNGICTSWQNCCELNISSGTGDNGANQQNGNLGMVSLIADKDCVEGCDFSCGARTSRTRSFSTVSACYKSCAVPPDYDGGSCIVLSSPASGFASYDTCCTNVTEDANRVCAEWQSCRLVFERNSSAYDYYLPYANGGCVVDSCESLLAKPVQGQGRAQPSLYDCYDKCVTGPFDGPFGVGLQVPCLGIPTLFGHATAFVPMTHVSCGLDCSTHGLATEDGNLNMNLNVGACCPPAHPTVSIKVSGLATDTPYLDQGNSPYSDTISVQPFSLKDLNTACEVALAGSWATPGSHKNAQQTVVTLLEKNITIEATCVGTSPKNELREYTVSLLTTCHDLNFYVPEP